MAPPPTLPANRPATLPALVYVLAAFGVISGSYGALAAVNSAAMFAKPREVYLAMVTAKNEPLKSVADAAALDRFDAREADARYGRRNAALPIAGLGIVLSCLMFAGAMRAMRGDGWGLSAWRFAAAASIPYQLVSLRLDGRHRARSGERRRRAAADGAAVSSRTAARCWRRWDFAEWRSCYYGVCVIYLRTPGVRRAFSAGAQDVRRHRLSERQRRRAEQRRGEDAEVRRHRRAGVAAERRVLVEREDVVRRVAEDHERQRRRSATDERHHTERAAGEHAAEARRRQRERR